MNLKCSPIGDAVAPAFQATPTLSSPCFGPYLLTGQSLSKAFGGQIVLDGVDLELRQGEVVLLRGENGSGKTTLLNILTGNLEPDTGTIHYLADGTPRSYRFPRRWWQELNPFDQFTPEFVAREGMGRTWQDVRLFNTQSLRDNIAVAEPGHPGENPLLALLTPGRSDHREVKIRREADAMLVRLGLSGRATSSADKISLGQSKRVAIARAVAAGARILFLDEPLAGLDRQGVADVLSLLESLVHERDVTLVIVEHVFNQRHLHELVTTDWLLVNGKLQRTSEIPGVETYKVDTGKAVQRPPWLPLLAGEGAEIIDEPLQRGAHLTRIRRVGFPQKRRQVEMEVRDLIVKRGPRTVIGLDDNGNSIGLNLTLYSDEIAILQAPNGWGKSTLFAAISGLIPSHSGAILLEGQALDGLSAWQRFKKGVRAMPSDHHSFPGLRVREAVQLGGQLTAIDDLGLLAERTCSSLSGGEKQRLSLHQILDSKNGQKLTMLDEPFSALDRNAIISASQSINNSMSLSIFLLVPSASR